MKRFCNLLYGLLGGLFLWIPVCFASYAFLLPEALEVPAYYGTLIVSGGICFLTLAYRYKGIGQSLLRSLLLFAGFVLAFVLSVQLGLIQYLDRLFQYQRDSENMGPGILMAMVLMVSFWVSVAANVVLPIWNYGKTRLFKHK